MSHGRERASGTLITLISFWERSRDFQSLRAAICEAEETSWDNMLPFVGRAEHALVIEWMHSQNVAYLIRNDRETQPLLDKGHILGKFTKTSL